MAIAKWETATMLIVDKKRNANGNFDFTSVEIPRKKVPRDAERLFGFESDFTRNPDEPYVKEALRLIANGEVVLVTKESK